MAGSLRTANYNLSKYAAGDTTSWLVDFNGNMDKIDKQMKINSDANVSASGNITALEQKVRATESETENNKNSIDSIISAITVKELISTASSNVGKMESRFYEFLGVFMGTSYLNINKTGDTLSVIEYGSPNTKLVPLILFTGNPFNLNTVTSPTESDLQMCGSIVYSVDEGTSSNQAGIFAYFNGTNTILSRIVSNASLTSSTTFEHASVTISVKKS